MQIHYSIKNDEFIIFIYHKYLYLLKFKMDIINNHKKSYKVIKNHIKS